MFSNSVISEGLAGMQQSHKKMQQSAEQIVKAGLPTDNSVSSVAASTQAAVTNNGAVVNDLPAASTVGAVTEADKAGVSTFKSGDIVESLVEMKQQELIFNASASVVSTGQDTIGQLIDDIS